MNGEEQACWVAANWEAVSMIVAGVLALLGVTGKAITLWRALKLVMGQLETPTGEVFRDDVKTESEAGSPGRAAVIRNMAARVDPDPKKQPKLRDALKGVAVDAVAGALGKLFRWGKRRKQGDR